MGGRMVKILWGTRDFLHERDRTTSIVLSNVLASKTTRDEEAGEKID
jgi:hypothetical protein